MKEYLQYYSKTVITMLLVVLTLGIAVYVGYRHLSGKEDKLRDVQVLAATQAQDIAVLENKLKVSKVEAEALQVQIKKAQQGKVKPVDSYAVSAENADYAAETVASQINNKDPAVPSAALEKTDRTVVAPQSDNKDYQVGVYKINLNKDHKIKAGGSYINGKGYLNAGYQQNRLEVIAHGQIENNKIKYKGTTAMWTVCEW